MSLLNTYEKFTKINTEFIGFTEQLIANNFNTFTDEQIKMNLSIALKNFEDLKFQCDEIVADGSEEANLSDLKYLIMSALFLTSDLNHFYGIGEYDRFKMRAVNYINHNKRNQMI